MTRGEVAALAAALDAVGVVLTSAVLSDGGSLIEVMREPDKPHPAVPVYESGNGYALTGSTHAQAAAWAGRERAKRYDFRDGAPVLKRTPKRLAALVCDAFATLERDAA